MELANPRVDVRGAYLEQPLDRELLDGKRAHCRAVDDGSAQAALREIVVSREIAHEAAGERVTGPRGIEDVLERIRRREEDFTFTEHERAVLALLHDDELRPAAHDPPRCLDEIVLLRELARLALVEGDEIDARQQLEELGTPALDPEVHRVARHQLRPVDLRQDVELKARVDVPEKDIFRATEWFRNLGPEVREDAEVGLEGLGDVQVVAIAPAPTERSSLGVFESREIDTALRQRLELLHGVITADDADELHAAEMTRGRREERRRAAKDVLGFAERRLHRIERDRTDYE